MVRRRLLRSSQAAPCRAFAPGFELKNEGGSVKIGITGSRSHRHVVSRFTTEILPTDYLTSDPLPHSFRARELSGAPPRALAQCSSEEEPPSSREGRRVLRSRRAPARPPSRPSRGRRAATPGGRRASPLSRRAQATTAAESRCLPRSHTSTTFHEKWRRLRQAAVRRSKTPGRPPRLAGLQQRRSPR